MNEIKVSVNFGKRKFKLVTIPSDSNKDACDWCAFEEGGKKCTIMQNYCGGPEECFKEVVKEVTCEHGTVYIRKKIKEGAILSQICSGCEASNEDCMNLLKSLCKGKYYFKRK